MLPDWIFQAPRCQTLGFRVVGIVVISTTPRGKTGISGSLRYPVPGDAPRGSLLGPHIPSPGVEHYSYFPLPPSLFPLSPCPASLQVCSMAAPGLGVGDIVNACNYIYTKCMQYKDGVKEFEEIASKAKSTTVVIQTLEDEAKNRGSLVERAGSPA